MIAASRRRLTRISPAHASIRRAASQLALASGRSRLSIVSLMAHCFCWMLEVGCRALEVLRQAPDTFDQPEQTCNLNRTQLPKIHVSRLDKLHHEPKPQ